MDTNKDDLIPLLKIYKIADDVQDVFRATEQSACFDVKAYLHPSIEVIVYTSENMQIRRVPDSVDSNGTPQIKLYPNERALIPTGLIFDIPKGYSVRAHPRSGLSIKSGITLCNAEGVIDSDYIEPSFITLWNISDVPFVVKNGDRVCQAELYKDTEFNIEYTTVKPEQKTSRNGGFGHSGV